ncbi:N-6 DNA methylase [Eoetvoesiella caeni]
MYDEDAVPSVFVTINIKHEMSNSLPLLSNRKQHGQYYTNQAIGALLVNRLKSQDVHTAIELGVGPGTLLDAVSSRWPDAKCISVDIDPLHNRTKLGHYQYHYCEDALVPDISSRIGLEPESADVAVCNPPFITSAWRPEFEHILSRAGLLPKQISLGFGVDILFLAQNLWMLRSKGQLGIIVPSGLICGQRSKHIRDWLLERHAISEVVELPAGTFTGTEVRTFLLCLTKDKSSDAPIMLSKVDAAGIASKPLYISQQEGSFRLDYTYFAAGYRPAHEMFVSQPRLEVIRGNIGANAARTRGIDVLHTTDIAPSDFEPLYLGTTTVDGYGRHLTAKKGDVIMARVGREFYKKIALVHAGESIISDCLFALRSDQYSAAQIHRALTSEAGQCWLVANSRGACARFVTKRDLENFPLKEILKR